METISLHLHNIATGKSMILYAVLIILAGKLSLILLDTICKKFLHNTLGAEDATDMTWKAITMQSFYKPLKWIIIIVTLSLTMDLLIGDSNMLSKKLEGGSDVLIISCLAWVAITFIKRAGNKWVLESKLNSNSANFAIKLLQVIVIAIGFESSLEALGLSTSGVLAFGSIGGAAIAFASQDLLSNFFGGLIIHLDKPFGVNDSIEALDGKIIGKIKYIGWRMTHISTQEKQVMYVPNSIFTKNAIKNTSHISHCYINEVIMIDPIEHETISKITSELYVMLKANEYVDPKQDITANLDAISLAGLHILLRIYTKKMSSDDLRNVKQDVLLKAYDIILRNGAKIATGRTT